MAGVASDSAKSAKNLAKQVAKQMAREPLEVLKAAGGQVSGAERAPAQAGPATSAPNEPTPAEKAKIEAQGQRQLAALEAEIRDIQNKKQQEAAIKRQQEQAQAAQVPEKELPKIPSKPSRRLFGFGQKAQAEKQKTRVEKPLPPSG